jgi:uncharacterized protein
MRLIKALLIVYTVLMAQLLLEDVLQMYRNDTLRSNPQALILLQDEATSGNANAMFLLATAYRNGKAGDIDMPKAYYWYKKSASKGDADAMLILGWLYYKQNTNIEANTQKARYWFKQAAMSGVEEAVEMLNILGE